MVFIAQKHYFNSDKKLNLKKVSKYEILLFYLAKILFLISKEMYKNVSII